MFIECVLVTAVVHLCFGVFGLFPQMSDNNITPRDTTMTFTCFVLFVLFPQMSDNKITPRDTTMMFTCFVHFVSTDE